MASLLPPQLTIAMGVLSLGARSTSSVAQDFMSLYAISVPFYLRLPRLPDANAHRRDQVICSEIAEIRTVGITLIQHPVAAAEIVVRIQIDSQPIRNGNR